LTRQFDANFPQFGPQPRALLRGSFEHTIYSDNDTISFTGFSNSFSVDRGKLRGLNRFLPTSEPVRVEPVNPSEWNGWTGTTFNLTINNDTQSAQSTRTSPQTIFEGQSVSVDVQADDVVNDSATFRWAWAAGTPIGNGVDDLFPVGTGNYQVDWAGGAAVSSAVGYRGNFTITSNPSPLSLTEGDVEEKGRTSIRVLDQFNNFINQHPVIVNRYIEPEPTGPDFPAVRSVGTIVNPYRNAQVRMNSNGTAQIRGSRPTSTNANEVFNQRWAVTDVPVDLRSQLRWSAELLSFNVANLQAGITNQYANPSLWNLYTTLDPFPGSTSFLVGLNAPSAIFSTANPTDIEANASWRVTVTLTGYPGFSEQFIASVGLTFPIRTNVGGGGPGDGVFD
jgi:hypothetical protein